MPSFASILDRPIGPEPKKPKRRKRIPAQAQKYSLVPAWRKRQGGGAGKHMERIPQRRRPK